MHDPHDAALRLGAQGWNYAAWTGPFYPSGTKPTEFLRTYARAFDTVEVDATFYAIPPSSTVRGWIDRTPGAFQFALKLPREITHERRFVNATEILERFVERARELEGKLGPILIQCGPDFSPVERGALLAVLDRLPSDVRFAIEFRQRAWVTSETLEQLRERGVALALSDGRWIPRRWLLELCSQPTARFVYVRWMGDDRVLTDYSRIQIDRSLELDEWTEGIRRLAPLVDTIFGYMNNHFAGHGPESLRMLQRRLDLPTVDPAGLGEQGSLFEAP